MAARRPGRNAGCHAASPGKPVFVFETGGTTGIPEKTHRCEDFRHRLRVLQRHAARRILPQRRQLADARPVGSTPIAARRRAPGAVPGRHRLLRRSRSAVGHQVIKKGWRNISKPTRTTSSIRRSRSCRPGHDIKCLFTTPKLLEALALRLESMGTTIRKAGITGIFSRRHRVHAAVEPLLRTKSCSTART